MAEIPVTYLCWGCGSQVTVMEETFDKSILPREVWNVCPSCRGKKVGRDKEEKIVDSLYRSYNG